MVENIDDVIKNLGEVTKKSPMKLIGITGRTSNKVEMSGQGIIPAMWNRFSTETLAANIPNQKGTGEIVAAYYNIESDDRSPYNFFIGMEVTTFENIPEEMISLEVPSGSFLKVTTEQGSLQTIGIETWRKIWESDELRKQRRFDVDLEIYGKEATNPDNGRFDIYIGI